MAPYQLINLQSAEPVPGRHIITKHPQTASYLLAWIPLHMTTKEVNQGLFLKSQIQLSPASLVQEMLQKSLGSPLPLQGGFLHFKRMLGLKLPTCCDWMHIPTTAILRLTSPMSPILFCHLLPLVKIPKVPAGTIGKLLCLLYLSFLGYYR